VADDLPHHSLKDETAAPAAEAEGVAPAETLGGGPVDDGIIKFFSEVVPISDLNPHPNPNPNLDAVADLSAAESAPAEAAAQAAMDAADAMDEDALVASATIADDAAASAPADAADAADAAEADPPSLPKLEAKEELLAEAPAAAPAADAAAVASLTNPSAAPASATEVLKPEPTAAAAAAPAAAAPAGDRGGEDDGPWRHNNHDRDRPPAPSGPPPHASEWERAAAALRSDPADVHAASSLAAIAGRAPIADARRLFELVLAAFPTASWVWAAYAAAEAQAAPRDDDALRALFARSLPTSWVRCRSRPLALTPCTHSRTPHATLLTHPTTHAPTLYPLPPFLQPVR
jgi:hypothetical protein